MPCDQQLFAGQLYNFYGCACSIYAYTYVYSRNKKGVGGTNYKVGGGGGGKIPPTPPSSLSRMFNAALTLEGGTVGPCMRAYGMLYVHTLTLRWNLEVVFLPPPQSLVCPRGVKASHFYLPYSTCVGRV